MSTQQQLGLYEALDMQKPAPRWSQKPRFDGKTFNSERDGERLAGQLAKVRSYMLGHGWQTLGQITAAVGGSEAGVSARLRDLRKLRFGGFVVERRYVAEGLWEYKVSQ